MLRKPNFARENQAITIVIDSDPKTKVGGIEVQVTITRGKRRDKEKYIYIDARKSAGKETEGVEGVE